MTRDVLAEIIAARRANIETLRRDLSFADLERRAASAPPTRSLKRALLDARPIGVIAELKKASPSKGLLCPDFSVQTLASAYSRGGASALSVLTEPEYFLGDINYLAPAREISGLPVLRKDFIVDPYQIVEARAFGADAILLIAAALDDSKLSELKSLAESLSLECLVEVHDSVELERAVDLGCDIIGVNNRCLKTFQVRLETSIELADAFPSAVCRVSESGIATAADVSRLIAAGFNAILVGEALVTSPDPESALRALLP